jgi:hypothetical protein
MAILPYVRHSFACNEANHMQRNYLRKLRIEESEDHRHLGKPRIGWIMDGFAVFTSAGYTFTGLLLHKRVMPACR